MSEYFYVRADPLQNFVSENYHVKRNGLGNMNSLEIMIDKPYDWKCFRLEKSLGGKDESHGRRRIILLKQMNHLDENIADPQFLWLDHRKIASWTPVFFRVTSAQQTLSRFDANFLSGFSVRSRFFVKLVYQGCGLSTA